MTIGEIQKILQNLLREKVPIKDIVTILESLADNSRNTRDLELLTEYVRFALARTICNQIVDENKTINVITLSPNTLTSFPSYFTRLPILGKRCFSIV